MKQRLQKIIADAGLASRREAERWISEGRVRVNEKVVTKPGSLADASVDKIKVKGRLLPPLGKKITIAFNKPPRCLTTMVADAKGRQTVMEFLKKVPGRVFPVGRLDYHTQGLILFTSDGDLGKKLLDPKNKVVRVYQAKVRGVPDQKALGRLLKGVRLDYKPTLPIEAQVKRTSGSNCFLELKLMEGKNRHVKRVCEKIGHSVIKLKRLRFSTINLATLPLGAWRQLTPPEVRSLHASVQANTKT